MAHKIRITQQRVETIGNVPNTKARVTQHVIENIVIPTGSQQARITQHAIEILMGPATAYTDGGFTVAPYGY